MNLNLSNKIAVVTGGASGVGEAVVRGFLQEQAVAVIVDRDEDRGEELAMELGERCLFVSTNLNDSAQCQRAIRTVLSQWQQIDVLVNNAGGNDSVGLEHGSPDKFTHSLVNNLQHYYTMTHYALPHLIKTKGNIVNVSSKTALTGQGGSSGYTAAKGAQLSLTRDWAIELLPYGIRVNAVVPAEVDTPMYQRWISQQPQPEKKRAAIEQRIPLGQRMTSSQEVANTVLFVASERASHTTGQFLFPDGGYTHLDRTVGVNP